MNIEMPKVIFSEVEKQACGDCINYGDEECMINMYECPYSNIEKE